MKGIVQQMREGKVHVWDKFTQKDLDKAIKLVNKVGTDFNKWLKNAISFMDSFQSVAFTKLRKIDDGQFGNGSIHHEPWTVQPFPEDKVATIRHGNASYYIAASQYNCFTYNPSLMRASFIQGISDGVLDSPQNLTPLRSGEDRLSAMWRSQDEYDAATSLDGPFRHLGHNSLRFHLTLNFKYFVKQKINKIVSLCRL
jgi:hypothetical protein